jgi:hypothetical protein
MTPELRLMAFARAELGRPFAWGDTNCVALALRAVDAMHGTELFIRHRRHMRSARRALAWTRDHGTVGVIIELLRDGLVEVDPRYAQPGDLLIGTTPDGQIAAHVCLGERVLSSTEADGVIQVRRTGLAPAPAYAVRQEPL